jgi:hypothetical protein
MNRALAGVAAFAAALFLVPGIHPAGATPPSGAVDSTTTLPLFGAPLVVDVTAAADGTLATVTLNPADVYTETTVKPDKVTFVNADGTVRIRVSTKRGGQDVSAKAGKLADIVGPGGWSGDVFDNGTITTVGFEVAAAADGSPLINNVTSSDPLAVIGGGRNHGENNRQHATASVTFTLGDQTRVLRISVKIGSHEEDQDSQAKISVALSKLRGDPAGDTDDDADDSPGNGKGKGNGHSKGKDEDKGKDKRADDDHEDTDSADDGDD